MAPATGDRILPFGARTAERERVLEVVDPLAAAEDDAVVALSAGDRVRVPRIGEEQRSRVTLERFVYRTGDFERRVRARPRHQDGLAAVGGRGAVCLLRQLFQSGG